MRVTGNKFFLLECQKCTNFSDDKVKFMEIKFLLTLKKS